MPGISSMKRRRLRLGPMLGLASSTVVVMGSVAGVLPASARPDRPRRQARAAWPPAWSFG
jgi:hypothetical protein